MDTRELATRVEAQRDHLRAVAYRMLGSLDEADDAVQRAWLRAERADLRPVENLGGWLTTVVSRICLDILRARRVRAEEPLAVRGGRRAAGAAGAGGAPGAGAAGAAAADPEAEAVMAESVGLALLVVLDRLSPAERVAFVLHDLFAVPFDEIAPVVDRSTVTTKKLASRARLRVRGEPPPAPEAPAAHAACTEHAAVVEAFLAASQGGDLDTLVTLLAPDVVRRSDPDAIPAGMPTLVRGARAVADEAKAFTHLARPPPSRWSTASSASSPPPPAASPRPCASRSRPAASPRSTSPATPPPSPPSPSPSPPRADALLVGGQRAARGVKALVRSDGRNSGSTCSPRA